MGFSRKKIIWVNRFYLCFFVALGFFLTSCENDKNEIARVSVKNNDPAEELKNLETLYSDSGTVRVRITAPVLKKMVSPKAITELPKGLLIEFYDLQHKVTSKLSANYAIHYEQESRWEAKSNVVVINEKGEQLNTEKLTWDERKEILYSDQFVKIKSQNEIIYGNGFEANQDFSHYRIFKVKGRIIVKE